MLFSFVDLYQLIYVYFTVKKYKACCANSVQKV